MDPRISTFFKLSLTCFITIYAMPFVDISGNKKKVLRAPFLGGARRFLLLSIQVIIEKIKLQYVITAILPKKNN